MRLELDTIASAEIVNGSIANADLLNSALTVTAGDGLAGGGVVALGASTTINLQTCLNGEVLKHNGTNWACAADATAGSFDISDGTNTQTITASDTLTFLSWTGLTRLVSATDNVTYGIANDGVTETQLNVSVAGNGLSGGGGTALAVNVDGSTITLTADTLSVPTGGITSTQIFDGTITGTDVANETITGANVLNNSIALTTDTTGNYVDSITAGNGISVSGAGR